MSHKWRATHVLTDQEGNELHVYLWRGHYFTSRAWHAGERGIAKADLLEGETIERLTDREYEIGC